MRLQTLVISLILITSACEKPFNAGVKTTPKFFIRAEITQSQTEQQVRIFVDFFNQSSQNEPIDTHLIQVELRDKDGPVQLYHARQNSNYGYGKYTYLFSSYSNFKCKPESQYTLKFKYKNDSFLAVAYLQDTIQNIKTIFNTPTPQIIHTYHQIVDRKMQENAYLLLQSSTDSRPYIFENFVAVDDSLNLLPNPERSGCFSKNIGRLVQATILKTDKKSAEMLREFDKNLNNEINPNPFFIPFTPKYNILTDFAYGYFVCFQKRVSETLIIPDPSETILTFGVTDANSNPIDLELVEKLDIKFRKENPLPKRFNTIRITNNQIAFTKNMALYINGFNDCEHPKLFEGDIDVGLDFILNGVGYTVEYVKFSPIGDAGKTIQLIAK